MREDSMWLPMEDLSTLVLLARSPSMASTLDVQTLLHTDLGRELATHILDETRPRNRAKAELLSFVNESALGRKAS